MTTETEYKITRPEWWPDGPWMTEPDRVQWKTKAGLPGLIVRTESGHLCGYVAVPPGHPLHGKGYNEAYDLADNISVHGGLTYAAACAGAICHVPEPGEPDDVWWFGFDCAHLGDWRPVDMAPYLKDLRRMPGHDVYRDVPYVTSEVESLAEQLAAAESESKSP